MISQDLKSAKTVAGHLFGTIAREFVKIFSAFLLVGVIGAIVVEGVGFASVGHSPTLLTNIAAGAFGIVTGYAAALTVAVREAIRGLLKAEKAVASEAQSAEKGISGQAGQIIKGVEDEIKKIEHH